MHMYMFAYTYTHAHIRIYMYIYMCVYTHLFQSNVCVYITYACIQKKKKLKKQDLAVINKAAFQLAPATIETFKNEEYEMSVQDRQIHELQVRLLLRSACACACACACAWACSVRLRVCMHVHLCSLLNIHVCIPLHMHAFICIKVLCTSFCVDAYSHCLVDLFLLYRGCRPRWHKQLQSREPTDVAIVATPCLVDRMIQHEAFVV